MRGILSDQLSSLSLKSPLTPSRKFVSYHVWLITHNKKEPSTHREQAGEESQRLLWWGSIFMGNQPDLISLIPRLLTKESWLMYWASLY